MAEPYRSKYAPEGLDTNEPWFGKEHQYETGNLYQQDYLMNMMLNNPDINELQEFLRGGYDPRTRQLIGSGMQQYQDLMGRPDAYGEDELNTFRSLISGDFFTDEMAGSFRDRVSRQMQPYRQQTMADLSARGLSTSGGEMGSTLGRLASEEGSMFQDIAAQNFLQAIGMGTQGLGAADTSMLNRTQMGYGMGADIRNFLENSQMNRMGIGTQLAGMNMSNLANLYNQGIDYRKYQQSKPNAFQQTLGAVMPFAIQAATGGAGGFANPAAGMGNIFDNTNLGQDYTQMFA